MPVHLTTDRQRWRGLRWAAFTTVACVLLCATAVTACGDQRASTSAEVQTSAEVRTSATAAVSSCSTPEGSSAPPCAAAGKASAGGYGTGVLSKTRFVKAPIIVLFTPSKPDPDDAGYTIYFRLSRDLPRDPAGGRNAVFAPFEGSADPILGLLARPGRWCFTQDVWTDPTETGLPTSRGSKIHLILKAHDSRHRTGTLPATATLRIQKPRAANDYRPYPYPKKLGCPLE